MARVVSKTFRDRNLEVDGIVGGVRRWSLRFGDLFEGGRVDGYFDRP